ncbi:MAG: CotH kinase family protein [Crocinitomicaceae bacterium]|nr:CotH kinase family protein [Crocinitomicaceae bacterium]MBK8927041.1 CotH kinase family protein [Crocinitomicaceae bacterium]
MLLLSAVRYILPFFMVCLLWSCHSKVNNETDADPKRFFCGGENLIYEGRDPFFDDGYGKFVGGGLQVKDTVFEGEYAIRLDSLNPYGLPLTLTNIPEGTYFTTSVWIKEEKSNATIIAVTTGRTNYTLNTTAIHQTEKKDGWVKYVMNFGIEVPVDSIKFFLFSGGHLAYFDNFEILQYKQRPPLPDSLSQQALRLYIPDSAYTILKEYKRKALTQITITDDLKNYVNGFILEDNDSIPIEIRLKGDWTDHLENGKTSYRIKTDEAYRGLTTFSIQHPQTRNYMHEWFMHRLFDMEGLLSTRYEFVPVEINGVNQGIYALEEHFDKQLLESRQKREGPIIKMDETGFWALLATGMKDSLDGSYPYFEASKITCFKEGRTEKSEVLSQQFQNASELLYLYKNRFTHPEQLLDLKLTAKYYAMMDLGNINHASVWHNVRFYYNPVTTKLELIGFDMIPAILPMNEVIGYNRLKRLDYFNSREHAVDFLLFQNEEFNLYYMNYIKQFSSPYYLDSIFNFLNNEMQTQQDILSHEFPNFIFDKEFYYDKAEQIRLRIDSMEFEWNNFIAHRGSSPSLLTTSPEYNELDFPFLVEGISLNAYRKEIDSTHFILQLENFHLSDMTLIGYSTKAGNDTIFPFHEQIMLKQFDGKQAAYTEIILPKKPNKVHFMVKNVPGITYTTKVFNWARPTGNHPRIELENKFKTTSSLYHIVDDTLFIHKGKHVLDELILIPSNYVVIVEPGAEIDMVNSAGIIINNSVSIGSSKGEEVTIYSSDSSSQGIVILQAADVKIENTQFNYLGNLNYKGWILTGAISIYEGHTTMSKVEISHNQCEDALNIIRGDFVIDELDIHHTQADGFDADFCTGSLTNSTFAKTGNDCIDFSGSEIRITDITINHAGDKGISCGELSSLILENISIDGALTAVASKDGSTLSGNNITAKNCKTGLALYRKKPEYPAAWMKLTTCQYENITTKALIERGGLLEYNGAHYFGYNIFDIDAMYAQWEK